MLEVTDLRPERSDSRPEMLKLGSERMALRSGRAPKETGLYE